MTDDRAELLERVHDQARMEMGFCVQASDGNWCTHHDSRKFPGEEEVCRVMSTAYVIAESAAEVAEPLIRADERAKAHVQEQKMAAADIAAAERARIILMLLDNYGDDYTGPVNLAAVLRIIGEAPNE